MLFPVQLPPPKPFNITGNPSTTIPQRWGKRKKVSNILYQHQVLQVTHKKKSNIISSSW